MLVMRRIANPSAIGETAVECRWPSWRRMSDAVGRGRTVRGRWTRHDGHGVRRCAARATVAAAGKRRLEDALQLGGLIAGQLAAGSLAGNQVAMSSRPR
jgi:hypothetical protein